MTDNPIRNPGEPEPTIFRNNNGEIISEDGLMNYIDEVLEEGSYFPVNKKNRIGVVKKVDGLQYDEVVVILNERTGNVVTSYPLR